MASTLGWAVAEIFSRPSLNTNLFSAKYTDSLSFLERDTIDADPEGSSATLPLLTSHLVSSLMHQYRARGWREGDIHIMGAFHPHCPTHHCALHKLHPTDAENTGCT